MSMKKSHRSSSGSLRGLGGGSSAVTRVSTVHSSGCYRPPSVHGGSRVSYGVGGHGSSAGSVSLGLGGAGGFGSGFGYGGGSAGGFGHGGGSAGGFGSGYNFGGSYPGAHIVGGEKETMQHLNDRLATYINQVHSLEQENATLEGKIREWYENQQPYTFPDYHTNLRTIEDIQSKIMQGHTTNANIILQIDNARLAADDFRSKCETEAAIRMGVESDINGLRRVLDELNIGKNDLDMQVQNLNEELQYMKKNHEEEVNNLRSQLGAKISVEVDAAPPVDLNKTLSEIRAQYENIIEKNEKDAEKWYIEKSEELNLQMSGSSQQLQTYNTEILQLNHTIQNLEIDLQTQTSLKAALENSLAETEGRYCSQLTQIQGMVSDVEERLLELRSDLERQNLQYKSLLDIKSHLEREILTYRQLLDGENVHHSSWYSGSRGGMSSGGSGGSGSISSSGGSGGIGGMSHSGSGGKPRVLVEDVREGFNQSK